MFFERELMEMFGVTVTGLADTSHLFLPDGWPEATYPLLKDTDVQAAAAKTMGSEPPEMGRQGDRFIVPIGPQHPALKEPGHFEFAVDGELVTGATVRLGYVHRGIERACEQQNYTQNLYLMERVCGICSHSHANAYVNGVEQLAKVLAPPRAQAIRQLVACLERIHSHFLWLGVAAYEAGFDTLLMYSWRDREVVMDVLEQMTGNRVNYSASVLGGVKYDVDRRPRRRHPPSDGQDRGADEALPPRGDDRLVLPGPRPGDRRDQQGRGRRPRPARADAPGSRRDPRRPGGCPLRELQAVSGDGHRWTRRETSRRGSRSGCWRRWRACG